jgi:hypothetical protein
MERALSISNFNAAFKQGLALASAAVSSGGVSYAFRSPIFRGILNTAEKLAGFAEETTSAAVATAASGDFVLYKALRKEIDAVRAGSCIPEGAALRVIILNR